MERRITCIADGIAIMCRANAPERLHSATCARSQETATSRRGARFLLVSSTGRDSDSSFPTTRAQGLRVRLFPKEHTLEKCPQRHLSQTHTLSKKSTKRRVYSLSKRSISRPFSGLDVVDRWCSERAALHRASPRAPRPTLSRLESRARFRRGARAMIMRELAVSSSSEPSAERNSDSGFFFFFFF